MNIDSYFADINMQSKDLMVEYVGDITDRAYIFVSEYFNALFFT